MGDAHFFLCEGTHMVSSLMVMFNSKRANVFDIVGSDAKLSYTNFVPHHCLAKCLSNINLASLKKPLGKVSHAMVFLIIIMNSFSSHSFLEFFICRMGIGQHVQIYLHCKGACR